MENQEKTLLEKVRELEHARIITIGVNRHLANTFWSREYVLGTIANYITFSLIILLVVMSFIYGIRWFFIIFVVICIYAVYLPKLAAMIIRIKSLNNEALLTDLYAQRVFTIRDNKSSEVFYEPDNIDNVIEVIYENNHDLLEEAVDESIKTNDQGNNDGAIQKNQQSAGAISLGIVAVILMFSGAGILCFIPMVLGGRRLVVARKNREDKRFIYTGYFMVYLPIIIGILLVINFVITALRGIVK